MDDRDTSQRRERGLAQYRAIYGEDAFAFEAGQSAFFDIMLEQLFGEIWTRPGLDIPTRRLLVMGVLAAQHRFDVLGIQFQRALDAGEFSVEQVREAVVQLIPYVGYPSSPDLYRVSEAAIAAHLGAGS